jgi:hypothetical protein
MVEPERRRRRLRPSSSSTVAPAVPAPPGEPPAGPPADTAPVAAVADPADEPDAVPRPRPAIRRPPAPAPAANGVAGTDDREAERGLRGLVGSGSSQVSVGAALRARDAARPTEAQLADADQNLAIVRRNWVPREELPRNR